MNTRLLFENHGALRVASLVVLLCACQTAPVAEPTFETRAETVVPAMTERPEGQGAPPSQPVAAIAASSPSLPPTAATPTPTPPVPAAPSAGEAAALPVEPTTHDSVPSLFWLDIYSNQLFRARADGAEAKVLMTGMNLRAPDGVAVDAETGTLYVLNMGSINGGANNGSLIRMDLQGGAPKVIMAPGTRVDGQVFNTGKQVIFDTTTAKLYLADREGSKVWRANADGTELEILISGHGVQQIVGVAVDPGNHFYFTDRNGRKVFRAGTTIPSGQTHENREDLELLVDISRVNAMPLDMEIDLESRHFYWTDRVQGAVFRASMDMPSGQSAESRSDVESVLNGLRDVIGIALDRESKTIYATHGQAVSRFRFDGSELEQVARSGSTGIAFARIPAGS